MPTILGEAGDKMKPISKKVIRRKKTETAEEWVVRMGKLRKKFADVLSSPNCGLMNMRLLEKRHGKKGADYISRRVKRD